MNTVSRNEAGTLSRRSFVTVASAAAATAGCATARTAQVAGRVITLPELPFAQDALAPVISARTLGFHHGKHHRGYVTNLNRLLPGSPFVGQPLETIVQGSAGAPEHAAIFNNAAQVWNHSFYWQGLSPAGANGAPSAMLAAAINQAFGSLEACRAALLTASLQQFGSGWAWLVVAQGKLKAMKTTNAETPLTHKGVTPLLTVDVWEHAYYLDWQNRRGDYAKALLEKVVNWQVVSQRFAAARA